MSLQDMFTNAFVDTAPGRAVVNKRIDALLSDAEQGKVKLPETGPLANPKVRSVAMTELAKKLDDPAFVARIKKLLMAQQQKTAEVKPLAWYEEHVGKSPMLDAAAISALSGLGTYAASGPLLSLASRMGAFGSPEAQAAVERWKNDPAGYAAARKKLALLGAGLGAGYGLYRHADISHGLKNVFDSITDKDYWNKHPELVADVMDKRTPEQKLVDEATSMESKTAMDNLSDDTYFNNDIDVHGALHAVHLDPVLTPSSKRNVNDLILNSTDESKTSGFNLTNSALKAGVSYGAAWLFGQGLGNVLGMPQPVVNRISTAGGIASAVIGSGILKEL